MSRLWRRTEDGRTDRKWKIELCSVGPETAISMTLLRRSGQWQLYVLTGRSCWRLLHCPLLPRLCASPTIQGGQIWNVHVIVISILIVITLDIKGSHILLLPAFNQFALQKLLLLRWTRRKVLSVGNQPWSKRERKQKEDLASCNPNHKF